MDGKGLVLAIPGGRRLQASHIRAVAQFGLSVAANVLIILCLFEKQLVLLRSTLLLQRLEKHVLMKAIGRGLADQFIGNNVFMGCPVVFDRQLS